jgi:hypothetical protein
MTKITSSNILGKMIIAAGSLLVSMILLLTFTTYTFAEGGGRYQEDPWSFGLMADTQWTVDDDPEGVNPEYISAALADVLQEEFIDYDVEFVIQVGDLSDRAGDAAMTERGEEVQPLYDAGIGFFPLRGNHETYGNLFGRDPEHDMDIPAYLEAFPQTLGLANTFGATNISSPSDIMTGVDILDGLSYSFDYGNWGNNARFVIVDVEPTSYWLKEPVPHPIYGEPWDYIFWIVYSHTEPVEGIIIVGGEEVWGIIQPGTWFRIASEGYPSTQFYGFDLIWPLDPIYPWFNPSQPTWVYDGTEFWPGDQQDWISEQLDKDTRGTEHAFVLSHRGLMGTNHVDCFFGSNPGSKSYQQNPFYASLEDNGVRYMLSGHDHLHNRALVESPDGLNQVQQIIHMAASTKFYSPGSLASFITYYGDVKQRETQISQELYNVGYYIYTIDGPRVLVDYYSDAYDNFQDNEDYPHGDDSVPDRLYMPELNFVKQESYGYSTNGQQFPVAQGESYTIVEDSFGETTANILSGANNSTTTDDTPYEYDVEGNEISAPRPLTKTVNTGWVANPDPYKLKSDILSLWGMSELGAEGLTDTYVLSMSFDFRRMRHLGNGGIGIATFVDDEWVNAVDENFGGEKDFVVGPYKEEYGLGTYGVDPSTKTAWAVLNYNADFAVAMDIEPVPGHRK